MTIDGYYGESPTAIMDFDPQWDEFMHFLYMPVRIPLTDPGLRNIDPLVAALNSSRAMFNLGPTLAFLEPAVTAAMADALKFAPHLRNPYVYVTARRGFAAPGNPLNRPGWHADDFGGTDLNYVWTDRFPTRFLLSDTPLAISDDDETSMNDMAWIAAQVWGAGLGAPKDAHDRATARHNVHIEDGPVKVMQRLTPYVLHNTPEIIEPGMRSFFKISVSTHRYDLIGNTHNHGINYRWEMHSREELRNQPSAMQNKDYSGMDKK